MSNELITTLGVLGGAFIGIVGTLIATLLSNYHTRKLEMLKIKEERRKEKLARDISIVEDVYQTLIRINDLCQELVYDIKYSQINLNDVIVRIKGIKSVHSRIVTLINLHLRDLKKDSEVYAENLKNYWNGATSFKFGKKGEDIDSKKLCEELEIAEKAYMVSFQLLQTKLEERMETITSPPQ